MASNPAHRLDPTAPTQRRRLVLLVFVLTAAAALAFPRAVSAAVLGTASSVETAMTWWKAVILGAVEGLTEYVPVSSTGHLLVVSRLLGLSDTSADEAAANTYAIAIQFGAIVAVAGLFWRRFRDMVLGLFGRSEGGRHLLVITVIAFVPAALVGFLFDDMIEDLLFGPAPIIAAWIVGGLLILGLERAGLIPHGGDGTVSDGDGTVSDGDGGAVGTTKRVDPILSITNRQALVIGLSQIAALWPGTSRSLATILGALLVGVGMTAAVEFSFILGFVTLTAATVYSLLSDGGALFDQFGYLNPLIGLVSAFVFAVVAIKWMIGYLESHGLAVFGWYRLVVAALALAFLGAGWI